MKVKRSLLALLMAVALLLGLLSGCGSKAPSAEATASAAIQASSIEEETDIDIEAAPEEDEADSADSDMESMIEPEEAITISYPLTEEEVVLTQWGSMYPGSFNYISSLSENPIIDELASRTGVRLECVSVQGGPNTIDQFTLMISAGDLPDFIDNLYSCYTAGADAAIEDGLIVDLAPYLDEHCPDFVRLYNEFDGMKAYATTDEGAVPYFLDVSRNADSVVANGYIIRQDYLDQVDMDMPETFDELHDVLAAFKNDLNVKSPLYIPKGVTGLLSEAYGTAASYDAMGNVYPYMVKDGEVICGYQTEELQGFLTLMNQWYSEGLIWQDFVTDQMAFGITTSSAYNTFLSGNMACAAGELPDIVDVAEQIGDGAVIAAMPDPKNGTECNHITTGGSTFSKKWAISGECEDVELACEFMNYLYTEEACDLLTYGIEGEACTKNDDGSFSYSDLLLNNPDGISYNNAYHIFTFVDELGLRDKASMRQFYQPEALAGSDVWGASRDGAYTYPEAATLTAEESEIFSAAFVNINTYVSECIPKFVIGDMDPQKDFETFCQTVEELGIEDCTAVKQAAYDRYASRMA